jgi:hypothetical protein
MRGHNFFLTTDLFSAQDSVVFYVINLKCTIRKIGYGQIRISMSLLQREVCCPGQNLKYFKRLLC